MHPALLRASNAAACIRRCCMHPALLRASGAAAYIQCCCVHHVLLRASRAAACILRCCVHPVRASGARQALLRIWWPRGRPAVASRPASSAHTLWQGRGGGAP